ncbi:aminopeptidase [Sphingomicrobium sp. XHP0235]|uniref:ABC transporter permease/M1 family aminopeptidase n=1 Tax=Sphingomicrobium aquimarinum TaxID=3133971 RepID=UPI0031FF3366
MLARIAAFEFRYQLRNPVFWVGVFLFFLLGFGLTASDNVSVGTPGVVKENGAYPILGMLAASTVFYLFILTSFVANTIVRDDASGFAPIMRSAPVGKTEMLFGRFTGSFLASVVGFLSIPLGLFVGSLMPWVDQQNIGPHVLSYYAWPFAIMSLPNLFFCAAALFTVATLTRSLMWSYVVVIALVLAYLTIGDVVSGNPELEGAFAKFDPFGSGALDLATRYWTTAEYNTRLIALDGNLLFNRLFIIALGIALLVFAWWRFSPAQRPASKRSLRKAAKREARDAALANVPPTLGGGSIAAPAGTLSPWQPFKARVLLEMRQMLRSPGLAVLVLLAIGFTAAGLWGATTTYGNDLYPTVASVVSQVRPNFSIFILIIAAFYGGEQVWRERDHRLNDIVDSTPTPAWAMTIPKVLAIFLVLVGINVIGMLVGWFYMLTNGTPDLAIGKWFAWFIFPAAFNGMLIAILAVALQILSPNKYVGWGLLLAWFLSVILMSNMGLDHPLLVYANSPSVPLSDMVDPAHFYEGMIVLNLYWGFFALLLVLAAHLLWPRGGDLSLRQRFARLRNGKMGRGAVLAGVAALLGMGATGAYAYYNTNVLNTYETSDDAEAKLAEYERRFLKYEKLAQPAITDVKFDVELYPDDYRMIVTGAYRLENDTDEAIDRLHVRKTSEDLEFLSLDVEGASLESEDEDYGYRIYKFARPLEPGAVASLTFKSELHRQGFTAGGPRPGLNPDVTFLTNSAFAPVIGMDRSGMLSDRTARRRQGLPDELRPPKLDDPWGSGQNYIGADWVRSDITITTDADQTPIAPGERVSDTVSGDRRTAHFVASSPILNFFSIQSGTYEIARRQFGDIGLEVYYQKGHEWNVPRMLDAMESALGYYQREFGPYQFDYARIIEFPYSSYAQAFAGTMPYSENIGFRSKIESEDDIDFVTYVIAHELGHQYWAHQALGGLNQGSAMTTETLASYSAIMVMKERLGDDQLRRFLKYELDRYLRNRKGEALEELPLSKVESQGYIYYQKGALAMHLLAERMGEDKVNAGLADYVAKWRFKGPPYPRSTDVIAALRAQATSQEDQDLITDMLEKIVLTDYKIGDVETAKVGDAWVTTATVEAAKYEADGEGKETEVKLDEPVMLGLFAARPGFGTFDSGDVLAMETRRIGSGKTKVQLTSKTRPAYVGVDPYNFTIDRNSDDNVQAVPAS